MDQSPPSSEAVELELLERVFLRLGAAETDDQLQATLERFLVPTILKSGSEFKSVQNKVLEILTHINRRLHSRPSVTLPMKTLLNQFTDQASSPQVSNFSLVYIKLGFHRLSGNDQAGLLPDLLQSLDQKRSQQQDSILRLFVPSLVHFKFPKDLSKREEIFSLRDKPNTRGLLLHFMQHYILLPYGKVEASGTSRAPAGLSWSLLERLTGDDYLQAEELEKIKIAVLRFLSSEIFSANEVLVHFISAAADQRHSVADEGDHLLKQFGSSADLDNQHLVSGLYFLYQGTSITLGKRASPQSKTSKENRSPASLRLRLRLMPYLLKSTLAANTFPSTVQVIFDSLFGEITNSKLQVQTLNFIQHICSRASDQKLNIMAPVILTGLNKIIDLPPEDPKLHSLSYVAIGSISKRVPILFLKETKYLLKIFDKLKKEPSQDLGLAIQECLSLMAAAYKGVKGQSATIVEALILENIYSEVTKARLGAVQYASSVFPFHHTPSRFVCMIACGDSKNEVKEEGKKGLKLPTVDNLMGWDKASCKPPDFCSMVQYLHKRATLATESGSEYAIATGKLPFHPHVLTEGIHFLRVCLSHSAQVTTEQSLLGTSLPSLIKYLATVSGTTSKCLLEYMDLLKQSLGPAGDPELHSTAMGGLLELVAAAPPLTISPLLLSDLQWIKGFTHSSRGETREPAARLFGLLAKNLEPLKFMEAAEQVLGETSDQMYNVQHGAVVCLGHLTATLNEKCARAAGKDGINFIKSALRRLVELLKSTVSVQLVDSSCQALGNIFRSGALPIPTGGGTSDDKGCGKAEEEEVMKMEDQDESLITKTMLVESLAGLIQRAKQDKLKEHCALSLGYLSVGEPLFPLKQAVLKGLFKLMEEKAIELQFTVGEAIAYSLAGPLCTASRDPWKVYSDQDQDEVTLDLEAMPLMLDDILSNYAVGTSPVVRQSSCIWLLSLLKHAGKHPTLQKYLKKIQMIFMDMLTEQSEVIQEVASRGMGLLYEMSEAEGRGELVEMLVGTLMEGRKSSAKVTDDTNIFTKGSLGKDPKGGNISTYKELCSLASDLNKPDLVYKFMSLANHNALWNSKKGAAFGFSSIASHAQEQLAPYLPNIVPRLYRYKYDPNPGVQQAMNNIWSAIIPESKKAMEKYLTEIMSDIITNLNSALWRNRESSCVALSDLLVTRHIGEMVDYIPQLWELVLRVRDDIKETVRKAADIACNSLHKVTIRACDGVTMSKTGTKVVEGVLPILMKQGMTNPSDDIKAISILSILKISQNAGVLLKPHIADLVPTLLESLSSLEPQKLNMFSLQFSGEKAIQEKLDDLRVAVAKSSPMMEVINLCIAQVGTEELGSLIPKLIDVMKSGVGLRTKVASAQLVISLVHHCLHDLTPFTGKLMNALIGGLSDRNSSVRKAYAKSIGHLVKVSKDTVITKTVAKLKTRYFEKNDLTTHSSTALVFHAMATYSLDTAKNFAGEILPLVFLTMHAKPREEDDMESFEASLSKWKDTWEEMVPGTRAGVRLYLSELVEMVSPALQSQSWRVKAQGAAAIATITENMGSNLGPPHLATLLTALLEALQGRTWEGKNVLLKSLSTVCKSCTDALLNSRDPNQPSPNKVLQTLLGQCKKKDLSYRTTAIECTGDALESLKINVFHDFSEIIYAILEPDKDHDSSDEEDRSRANITAKLDLQVKSFLALGQAWPSDQCTQDDHYDRLITCLSSSLPNNHWKLQVAILSSIACLYDRLVHVINVKEICQSTLPTVCQCLGDVKYNAVHTKALVALEKIVLYLKGVGGEKLPEATESMIISALKSLSNDHLKDQAETILKTLSADC